MKKIFDYLPFFIVALFAVTLVFPKFFSQKDSVFGANVSKESAIEQLIPLSN
jgi:hypothetical protein